MQELVDHLMTYVSDHKKALFEKIIQHRTKYFSVVLENVYQAQNASAVLRTCDCLGIQNVNIIENDNDYQLNPTVTLGSNKWLSINRYNEKKSNTSDCLLALKKDGYKIVTTSPHQGSIDLRDLEIDKYAFVLGAEKDGISDEAYELSDLCLKIPMYGFTESYNISVSASIILSQMIFKLRASNVDWRLNKADQQEVLLNWARSVVKRSDLIEKEFLMKLSE
ncbi:MAG: RNA methyltransferase [Flavobacteriales bacterium]|nr:RNA methyltransferase [Flavobacteriales bacterium]